MQNIKFIQIRDALCREKGYINMTYSIQKTPVSWDKSIYYFCEVEHNKHDFYWFIEDDVFVPNVEAISYLDNKYKNYTQQLLHAYQEGKEMNLPIDLAATENKNRVFKNIDGIQVIDKKLEAHSRKVAALRNSAADKAKYDIVFCDDDIILDKNWLDKLLEFSSNEGWDVLGNRVLSPDGTRYWDRSLLNPHVLVDYEHPKEDNRLYQSSAFFLVRKDVFSKVRWDETKLVFADRENKVPEDLQYSFDLKKNGFALHFNKNCCVWHNDERYTQFNNKTILREVINKETGLDIPFFENKKFTDLKESYDV